MDGYILGAEMKKVTLRPTSGFFKYFGIIMLIIQLFLVVWVFKDFNSISWKYYLRQSILILIGLSSALFLVNKYFLSGYISPF